MNPHEISIADLAAVPPEWQRVIGEMLSAGSALEGLPGLKHRFERAGLAPVLASWLGDGTRLTISADTLLAVLGAAALDGFAGRLGLSLSDFCRQLSGHLPVVLQRLSRPVALAA